MTTPISDSRIPGPHLETPAGKRRARAVGIPFDGTPGPLNSITDVADTVAATDGVQRAEFLPEETIHPLFTAAVRATDEAVVDSMVASETMIGRDGHTVVGIPHRELQEVMRRYGR